jgi:hypothetical protein
MVFNFYEGWERREGERTIVLGRNVHVPLSPLAMCQFQHEFSRREFSGWPNIEFKTITLGIPLSIRIPVL